MSHPHTNCPHCKSHSCYQTGSTDLVPKQELVEWHVKEGWRGSKQELMDKFLEKYNVTRK